MKNFIPQGCIFKKKNDNDVLSHGWSLLEKNSVKGTFSAVLTKSKQDRSFGLTIAGGADKDCEAHISCIKTDGLADRSSYFCVGDRILEIDNKPIGELTHEEIIKTIQQTENNLKLKILYARLAELNNVEWRRTSVLLKKGKYGAEFLLTGGSSSDGLLQRPVLVSKILLNTNLESQSILFPGDEIVAVENQTVNGLRLTDVNQMITSCKKDIQLIFEYPVCTSGCQKTAANTFIVELVRPNRNFQTGITLNVSSESEGFGSIIIISHIKEASLAERCGKLHEGDLILSLNHVSLDGVSLSVARQMLSDGPRLVNIEILRQEIIHCSCNTCLQSAEKEERSDSPITKKLEFDKQNDVAMRDSVQPSRLNKSNREPFDPSHRFPQPSPFHSPVYSSFRSGRSSIYSSHIHPMVKSPRLPSGSLHSYASNMLVCKPQSCRQDMILVTCCDKNLGIQVQDAMSASFQNCLIIVDIVSEYAIARTGLVQVGDRILSVNRVSTGNIFAIDFHTFIDELEEPIVLAIEFDVSDAVTPNQGLFSLKVHRNHANVGIFLASPGSCDSEQFLRIVDVVKGSPAHRLGMLFPGDQVLSVNGNCVSHLLPEDVYHMFNATQGVIEMTIKKDEELLGPTFLLELERNGQSLGVTLSGSEIPFSPVIISSLSEDGLAYRSNAIMIGDKILAINGCSLRGKTLTQAYNILQNTTDKVKFLIKRSPTTKIENSDSSSAKSHVWTWNGDRSVHVVDDSSTISMICEKKSPELPTDTTDTYSDSSDYQQNRYTTRKPSTRKSRNNSDSISIIKPSRLHSKEITLGSFAQPPGTSESMRYRSTTREVTVREHIDVATNNDEQLNMSANDENYHRSNKILVSNTKEYVAWSPNRIISDGEHVQNPTSSMDSANEKRIHITNERNTTNSRLTLTKMTNRRKQLISRDSKNLLHEDCDGSLLKNRSMYIIPKTILMEKPFYFKTNMKELNSTHFLECVTSTKQTHPNIFKIAKFHLAQPLADFKKSEKSSDSSSLPFTSTPGLQDSDSINNNNGDNGYDSEKKYDTDNLQDSLDTLAEFQLNIENSRIDDSNRFTEQPSNHHQIILLRDDDAESFGFSISHGNSEKDVFVRSIQDNSIADQCGMLKKCDRILEVNGVVTRDLTCNAVLPLLKNAGRRLELMVKRDVT